MIGNFILKVVFGAVVPLLSLMAFWWSAVLIGAGDSIILLSTVSGLIAGLVIEYFIVRKGKFSIYKLRTSTLILIYVFYSICFFGFFMGVPVFNLVFGPVAGYYWARKLVNNNPDKVVLREEKTKVSVFTALIMGLICLLSAYFAFTDVHTAANLKGMFNLSFEVSNGMLIGVSIAGGVILFVSQYFLTDVAFEKTYRNLLNLSKTTNSK
jgi:nicotinamide riboside transporter PnuC